MDRALAEDQPADRARPESFGVKQTILEIVDIVQAVEADDALHAVRDEPLHPEPAYVVRFEFEAERALAANDDLPARPGKAVAQRPQPIPRVLLDVAYAGIEMDCEIGRAHV